MADHDDEILSCLVDRVSRPPYDLHGVSQAYEQMGRPLDDVVVVLVGGTNGKGTTCGLLALMLEDHGYRVGLYTSPHMMSLQERCEISGVEIEIGDFIQTARFIKQHIKEEVFSQLSSFELMSLVAFDLMSHHQVDVAVVEVGMGGAYDATNVLAPTVSIITSIGLDHIHELGGSLRQIAQTKSAIRRPHQPLIIGADATTDLDDFWTHLSHDRKIFAPAYCDDSIGILRQFGSQLCHPQTPLTDLTVHPLASNASCAYQALEQLKHFSYLKTTRSADSVTQISSWRQRYPSVLTGRGQWIITSTVHYFVDTAHNPQAFRASCRWFKQTVQQLGSAFSSSFLSSSESPHIIGLVHFREDKQPEILRQLAIQTFDHTLIFGGSPHSAFYQNHLPYPAVQDSEISQAYTLWTNFDKAWAYLIEIQQDRPCYVYVGGSFFACQCFFLAQRDHYLFCQDRSGL